MLVAEFGATSGTYCDDDSGVRLRVGQGCLSPGQVAGPISVLSDMRYVVESGGSSFLVSTVVDCKPSGAFFLKPLELEFCVEEEDGDENSEESDGEDGEGGEYSDESDRDEEEGLQEYLARLRTTYKVTWSLVGGVL